MIIQMSVKLVFSLLTELSKEGLVPRIIQSLGKSSLSTSHPYRPGRQHVQHSVCFLPVWPGIWCPGDVPSSLAAVLLPLGLSSQDYLCTSFELLGITLACPCFPLGGPKFYYLTPSGCCASLSLCRFSWWCAPKKHLFRILDAVLSLLKETFLSGDRHCLSRWQTITTVHNICLVLPCARHLLIPLKVSPG